MEEQYDSKTLTKAEALDRKTLEMEHAKLEYKWKHRFDIFGCNKKISKNIMHGKNGFAINNFEKSLLKKNKYNEAREELLDWLKKQSPGTEIKVDTIKEELNWKSLGTLERKLLDYFVCLGRLEKIEFSQGRKGHTYKVINAPKCFYLTNNLKEEKFCKFENWIFLGIHNR